MKKFTESETHGILKEHEQGIIIRELSRKHEVSRHTIGGGKHKYGWMPMSDIKRNMKNSFLLTNTLQKRVSHIPTR
jgi:hypothetical protein